MLIIRATTTIGPELEIAIGNVDFHVYGRILAP